MSRNSTSQNVSQLLASNGLWCVSYKWRYQRRWLVRCGVGYVVTAEDLALPEYEGIMPQWYASLARTRTCLTPTGETFTAGGQLILREFAVSDTAGHADHIYLQSCYLGLHADPARFWLIHPRAVLVMDTRGDPVGVWATFRPRVRISRLEPSGRRSKRAPLVIDPISEATHSPARNLDELFERLFE